MRIRAILVAGCCAVSPLALADPTAHELQAQGEELAKQARYTDAIDAFKAADKLETTATHACLIALAYTRRELWPQAEIWLAMCQVRANANDPLPDWAPAEKDQIDQRLAAANVAPITISVEPAAANAKMTVSSFAPDEQFTPRTIHLPPGKHTVIVTAPGYLEIHRDVDVADKTAQTISIQLQKPGVGGAAGPDHRGRNLIIAGAVALAVGGGALYWWSYEHTQIGKATTGSQWDSESTQMDIAGVTTYSGLILGVGLVAAGVYFKLNHHDEVPAVTFAPLHGGGVLAVGWTR